jgi:hypothetical protein
VEDEKLLQTADEAAINRAWFEAWAADVLLDRFEQAAIYVKYIGGGASVTTRVVTKADRAGTTGGLTQ